MKWNLIFYNSTKAEAIPTSHIPTPPYPLPYWLILTPWLLLQPLGAMVGAKKVGCGGTHKPRGGARRGRGVGEPPSQFRGNPASRHAATGL